jgi:hypothetical protein
MANLYHYECGLCGYPTTGLKPCERKDCPIKHNNAAGQALRSATGKPVSDNPTTPVPAAPGEKLQQGTPHTVAWVASVISENPLIASLLYDIDLLPEQIKEGDERRYNYMLAVIGHMKAALSATAPLATEHRARGLTPEVVATHYPQTQHQPDECEICDCVFKIAAEALATADNRAKP